MVPRVPLLVRDRLVVAGSQQAPQGPLPRRRGRHGSRRGDLDREPRANNGGDRAVGRVPRAGRLVKVGDELGVVLIEGLRGREAPTRRSVVRVAREA